MPPPDLPHPLDEPHPDLRSGDYVRFCALYREYSGRCRAVARGKEGPDG